MSEIYWKTGFTVVYICWVLSRALQVKPAMKGEVKQAVRPGFEFLMVGLNFIGMMVLPFVVVFTPLLDGFKMDIPGVIRGIALFISVVNVWFFMKIHKDLGRNWSPVLEIKEGHTLVQNGVYKAIRHPMYAHIWMWVITQGIVLNNWLVLVFGVVAWGVLYFIRVPREEQMLLGEFGDQYREYMKKTGRVIPRFPKP